MFEGSEKKLEIIFSSNIASLRSYSEQFWNSVIEACDAQIISKTQFKNMDSYILSESSMFVWDHRLILITCGKTTLANSAMKILKSIHADDIEACFFQRKNEFFPKNQKSDFSKDVSVLSEKIKGKTYQFGDLQDRHFFLFYTPSNYKPLTKDSTLEVLMYNSKIKDTSKSTIENLQKQLEKVLPDFEIEKYFFEPHGCSINAVQDNFYYTIHITPEESFFYISFETNFDECSSTDFIDKILQIFQSSDFDMILFQSESEQATNYENSDYFRSNFFHQSLNCGYQVSYMNLKKHQAQKQSPKHLSRKENL